MPSGVMFAKTLYAVRASACAHIASASPACIVPFTIPGGNPVIERPGQTPKSPLMTLGPVLVTVEAPRTPKLAAVPKMVSAYDRLPAARKENNSAARSIIFMVVLLSLRPVISVTSYFITQSSNLGGGPRRLTRASLWGEGQRPLIAFQPLDQ